MLAYGYTPNLRNTHRSASMPQGMDGRLLRIQLHDQVLVDVRQHLIAPRHRLEHAAKLLVADLEPLGETDLGRHRQRTLNAQLLARLLADLDHFPGLDLVRGNRHDVAADVDRLVRHQLARLGARCGKTHAVDDVVQPALQELQQRLAGGPGAPRRGLVVIAKLALEHAIHAAQLLLLAQLQTVARQPLAPLALDAAGGHLQLALALERLGAALEEQIRALAAGELAGWTAITRPGWLLPSPPLDATLLGGTAAVVRDRRDVGNARDLQPAGVEGTHRRLATRTGAGHAHLDVLHPMLLGGGAGLLGRHLGRKRRALARTAKATATRGGPGQRIALPIGDRDDRVVERCMHVSDRVEHVFARLLGLLRPAGRALLLWFLISHRCGCLCAFSRSKTSSLLCFRDAARPQVLPGGALSLTACLRGPLRVRALVRVRCPRTGRPLRCRRPRHVPKSMSRLIFIDTSRRRSPSTGHLAM